MRGHAESLRDRLEVLVLLVNAGAGAPPPRLVDEGAMGRIHQTDDAVVHVAGQVGREMGRPGSSSEARQRWWFGQVFGAQAATAGIRYVDPCVAVAFDAWI